MRATIQSITDSIPALVAYVGSDRRYVVANRAFEEWLGLDSTQIVGRTLDEVLSTPDLQAFQPYAARALAGEAVTFEARLRYGPTTRDVEAKFIPDIRADGTVHGYVSLVTDVTDRKQLENGLREQLASAAELAKMGQLLAAELDLERLVQAITDSATQLSGAHFGAFFYNVQDGSGESYTLYTISGVDRSAFANFPMPRNTAIFDPTFRGKGVVRLADVTKDSRYGNSPPHHGLPEGHLPVRSYLAVPVVSRTGEVLGGLFFGHAVPGVFTARQESLVVTLASQAAVAIDNSRLFAALEKQRAEAQDASQQYRFLAESIPQLVWTSGPSGALTYVNQRWVDYTGLSPEDSRGTGWSRVLHPDDVDRTSEVWAQSVAASSLYEVTARVRRGTDGVSRWFLARAFPLKDHEGRVVSWFGTCTDIHDQKTHEDAERLLSEASRVLSSSLELSETLPTVASMLAAWFHGYCIVDLLEEAGLERAAAVHMDPSRQPLLNAMPAFSPRDDRTSPLWHVIQARQPELCNSVTEESTTSTSTSAQHASARRALGTTGYILAPLIAGGRVAGTVMIGSTAGDAFEPAHLRTVQELAYRLAIAVGNSRAYRDARDANRLKDEFLAVVSHELRTPLNAMRGWMTLLRGSRLDDVQRARAIDIIDRNITAQTQLVDDLLDVSRIVTGNMRLNVEPVDLAVVARAALESIAPAAGARTIAVDTALDDRVGMVLGDPARLQQVVWNLLSNAIKFTPPGGRVTVSLCARAAVVELRVTDTGQGISPEFLPYVFERFRQGDSTTTRPVGGLGIGLAIVRHLAELHGGTVAASSEGEGRGATFVLSLPAGPTAA